MAFETSSQTQPKPLAPASNVYFQVEDCIIKLNNEVALMESKDDAYTPLLQFLKKSYISVALTKQPSAYYLQYLWEFWYTAEPDMATKTITFTLSHISKTLSFDLDTFSSVIGLEPSDDYVSIPPKETVKAALANLGLVDEDHPYLTSSTLINSSPVKVKYFSPTWKPAKEFVATANPPKRLEASKSAEVQGNQPETADAKKEEDAGVHSLNVPTFEQLMDEVDKQNKAAQEDPESPFDTELEIKLVKSFKGSTLSSSLTLHLEINQTNGANISHWASGPIDMELEDSASDLNFMPDDDLISLTSFETANSDDNDESHSEYISKEDTTDNLNAFADVETLSNLLGYLRREFDTLSSKVDQLESNISKQVSEELKSSVPSLVSEALNETLLGLLADALKAALPNWQQSQGESTHWHAQDMNFLLKSVEVFKKANAEGEKWEKNNPETKETRIKRLAGLKAENEKSEESLKKMFNSAIVKAQTQKWEEHKEKKAKMLKEYNGCILKRTDTLPITKISNRIKSYHEASMRITKKHDPLNIQVCEKFRLNFLCFSEWLKIQALASKVKGKSNDQLLKNLKAKFKWVVSQAKGLGIPPPPTLANFGVSFEDKKIKRTEILKEVFVKENVIVDETQRNLAPPLGVLGRKGLVIREPEAGFFPSIMGTMILSSKEKAEDMFKLMKYEIGSRNDVVRAGEIVENNLDGMGE
ncbi:hypothetical protein Tco_0389499 [Tanacetum coccineum]